MASAGYYDKEVGIIYSIEKSKSYLRDLWTTNEDFTFYIGEVVDQRYVTVPKGFLTDGASVPRFFWSIFPPWGVYGQAAIVHDYLCTHKRLSMNGDKDRMILLTQREIDDIFYDAMKAAGTPIWQRAIIYGCVKVWHFF